MQHTYVSFWTVYQIFKSFVFQYAEFKTKLYVWFAWCVVHAGGLIDVHVHEWRGTLSAQLFEYDRQIGIVFKINHSHVIYCWITSSLFDPGLMTSEVHFTSNSSIASPIWSKWPKGNVLLYLCPIVKRFAYADIAYTWQTAYQWFLHYWDGRRLNCCWIYAKMHWLCDNHLPYRSTSVTSRNRDIRV